MNLTSTLISKFNNETVVYLKNATGANLIKMNDTDYVEYVTPARYKKIEQYIQESDDNGGFTLKPIITMQENTDGEFIFNNANNLYEPYVKPDLYKRISYQADEFIYKEYELDDEPLDSFNSYKKELHIHICSKLSDITRALTAYYDLFTDEVPSISEKFFKVVFMFDFDIMDVNNEGELIENSNYIFDIDKINDIETIPNIEILNTNAIDKVVVAVHFEDYTENETTVITKFLSTNSIKFTNCILPDGIHVINKVRLMLDFDRCIIYEGISAYSSYRKSINNFMSFRLLNCHFENFKTIALSEINKFEFRGTTFNNEPKSDDYFIERYKAGNPLMNIEDFQTPSINLDHIQTIIMEDITIHNWYKPIRITDSNNVDIRSIKGSHILNNKPIPITLFISRCSKVSVADYTMSGIDIDACGDTTISQVVLSTAICTLAPHVINISRMIGTTILTGISVAENSAKTGIIATANSGKINISDSSFDGIPTSIRLNSNKNAINISDCNFVSSTETALQGTYCSDNVNITECTFADNMKDIFFGSITSLNFDNVTIDGKASTEMTYRPDVNNPNFKIESCENVNLSECTIKNSSNAFLTCHEVGIIESGIASCYTKINECNGIDITEDYIELSGVRKTNDNPFLITNCYGVVIHNTRTSFLPLQLDTVIMFTITGNTFENGILIAASGNTDSVISDNIIGNNNSDGIILISCSGVNIFSNKFNLVKNAVAISTNLCDFLKIMENNSYENPDCIINVANGHFNNSLVAIDTDKDNAPILSPALSTGNAALGYKYYLYILNREQYFKEFKDDLILESIEDARNLLSNIVIRRSFSENQYLPQFINEVTGKINNFCDNI